jgi:hypothetical protein
MKRLLSLLMLASGIALVFGGFNSALGFTLPGMVASLAAIAALLYAGSAWFGAPPAVPVPAGADTVIVFDRDLHIAAGPAYGTPLLNQFPPALRPEIEVRCRAALRGESTRFVCSVGSQRLVFDAAPVTSVTGVVLYGILIGAAGFAAPSLSAAPLSTTA